ncbi:Zinc finger protein [Plecturocebus cupreus]
MPKRANHNGSRVVGENPRKSSNEVFECHRERGNPELKQPARLRDLSPCSLALSPRLERSGVISAHSLQPPSPRCKDSPASASQVAGITGVCHHTRLIFIFFVELGFQPACWPGWSQTPDLRWSARLGPPECWDYRHEPLHLAKKCIFRFLLQAKVLESVQPLLLMSLFWLSYNFPSSRHHLVLSVVFNQIWHVDKYVIISSHKKFGMWTIRVCPTELQKLQRNGTPCRTRTLARRNSSTRASFRKRGEQPQAAIPREHSMPPSKVKKRITITCLVTSFDNTKYQYESTVTLAISHALVFTPAVLWPGYPTSLANTMSTGILLWEA